MSRRKWSIDEAWYLKERYLTAVNEGVPRHQLVEQLSRELGRSPGAVRTKLSRLGNRVGPRKAGSPPPAPRVSDDILTLLKPLLERAKEVDVELSPEGHPVSIRVRSE